MAKEKEKTNNQQSSAQQPAPSVDPLNQLVAIKDIIMGPEMRDVRDQLAAIRQQIQDEKNDLESQINHLQETLTNTINELNATLNQKIDANQQHTTEEFARVDFEKTNRKDLGQLLIQLGESLKEDK